MTASRAGGAGVADAGVADAGVADAVGFSGLTMAATTAAQAARTVPARRGAVEGPRPRREARWVSAPAEGKPE
ncbi:hypothetical protein [Nakamurella aerolata]|uniref:Uncharacterized protein n=1 Tax=Nakamurella aerolata TaxID=1656892 RepID=A0A849A887_9ACTN|nr:hypothetical protein [Nakamurella aerolata]NNG35826.1 hypothetical protein [Nakamurella aerolata]